MHSIEGLNILRPVFTVLEQCTGLILRLDKGVIVPIATRFNLHVKATFKEWLEFHLLAFSRLRIEGFAKYLGFIVGPGAGGMSWQGGL